MLFVSRMVGMEPLVFISHRSLDKSFASAIADVLRVAGIRYYLDAEDVRLASGTRDEIASSIQTALREASHVIAIVSPFSRNSWWTSYELGVARERSCKIAAVVQSDVRRPEYLDNAAIIDSRDRLMEWVSGIGSVPNLDTDLQRRLDSWLARKAASRASLYRNAVDHLQSLWRSTTWTSLALADPEYAFRGRWMGCASDELIHILYSMLAPIAALKGRTGGLSEGEGVLIDEIYKSFANDELVARIAPAVPYAARKCTDWRRQRREAPATYWLQGLLPRDLDAALSCLLDGAGELLPRETVAARYLELFHGSDGSAQKPLGLAANALQGFELRTRPVFARLIAVQVRLYGALLRVEQESETRVSSPSVFDLEPGSPLHTTIEEATSQVYLAAHVIPTLARSAPS